MSQMTEATTPQGENTTQSSKIPTPLAEIEINSGVGDIITQLGHTSSHLVEISTQAGGSTSSLGETTSRTSGLQGRPTQPATSSDVGADVSGDHEVTNNNNGETTREEPGESSEHYMTTSDLGGTDVSDNTDKLGEHTTTNPAIIDSSGLTMDNVDGSSGEGIWQSETAQQTDVTKGIGHSSSAKEDDGSEGMELSSTKESRPASIIGSTDGVGGSLGLGVSGPEDADIGGGIANDLAVTDATIADVPAVSNAQNTSPEFGDESSSSQSATSSHSGPLGGNSDDSSGVVGTTRSSSQAAMSGIEGSSTSKEVEFNPATSARAEESATSTKPSASSPLPSEAPPSSSGQSKATTISSASDEEEISASAKSATTMSSSDANMSSPSVSELQSTTQTDEQVSGSSSGVSTQVSGDLALSSTAPSNNFSPDKIDISSGNVENSIASFGSYADSTKAETIKPEDKTEPGDAPTSSNHNDDTTEPVEQTRTTTARIDHETTSGETDIVINLKTVGSNIISSSVEEGGDDLTTRQLTFYTGSTKDNVIPDQTRHNDLQDKATQTTKTLDTLTQDSTKTNDDEMETTTDNKQAPAELNSSVLPSSETDVNTISNDLGETKEPLSTQLAEQTMTSTVEEIEATKASQGPTNPAWTDTTIDPAIDLNGDLATPEPDKEQNNNLVQDLTHASSISSSSTTPCVCPSTTISLGTTDGSTTTKTGTTTASGECLCPDIFGPAEVETATDLPATSGGRRRREWEEDDLFVDDFDQKILKKMPFLKFY